LFIYEHECGFFLLSMITEYKGYFVSIEFSEADKIFFGKITGIRSLISYEGENADEILEDFHSAVDDNLEMCESENIEPEKAYKGSFNVRIFPELHKKTVISAMANQESLNSFV